MPGQHSAGSNPSNWRSSLFGARSDDRPVPISKSHGVTGRDKVLVATELRRLQLVQRQSRRRKAAAWAGAISLLVGGLVCWFLGEAVIALFRSNSTTQFSEWLFALIEIILNSVSLAVILSSIPWIRHGRRPSLASKVLLRFAFLVVCLQISQVVIDAVLIYHWRDRLQQRCFDWSVDVVWTIQSGACPGSAHSLNGFWIACGIRGVCTMLVGSLWLFGLHNFSRRLWPGLDAEDSESKFLQSAVVQGILGQYQAAIVILPSDFQLQGEDDDRHHLPPMPEAQWQSVEGGRPPTIVLKDETQQGWLSWFAEKLFGVTSSDDAAKEQEMDQIERRPPSAFSNNPLHPDYRPISTSTSLTVPPQAVIGSTFTRSFSGLNSEPSFSRLFVNGHRRTDSEEVPLTSPIAISHSIPESNESWHEYDSAEDSDREVEDLRHDRVGSSTTTLDTPDKPLVYVRMGNGQLVHKLSTIHSDTSNRGSIGSTSILDMLDSRTGRESRAWRTSTPSDSYGH